MSTLTDRAAAGWPIEAGEPPTWTPKANAFPVDVSADAAHRESDALRRVDTLASELLNVTHKLAAANEYIAGLRADCDQAHRLIKRLGERHRAVNKAFDVWDESTWATGDEP